MSPRDHRIRLVPARSSVSFLNVVVRQVKHPDRAPCFGTTVIAFDGTPRWDTVLAASPRGPHFLAAVSLKAADEVPATQLEARPSRQPPNRCLT